MIEVHDLRKRYGRRCAVDGLSFTVHPGRVTGLLGPNGSGKSTTMRLILGLARPDHGYARVGGRPYGCFDWPLRQVGALLDAQAAHPDRTAANHLRWLAHGNRLGAGRVEEVLHLVGLTPVAGERVGGFSLGMRQRLGIAAALLGDPPVLLLDEPTNGLDPDGVRWMRGLLADLARQGRTVLVATHLIGELAHTADHLVVVGDGRLLADAPVAEITGGYPAGDTAAGPAMERAYLRLTAESRRYRTPEKDPR